MKLSIFLFKGPTGKETINERIRKIEIYLKNKTRITSEEINKLTQLTKTMTLVNLSIIVWLKIKNKLKF